ncbi:MAG TPA: hypothetical protein VHN74_02615 [Candidatus Angelobacter sp.]|nr:hypothetical protein [Candidatus Angelobacter sp.]
MAPITLNWTENPCAIAYVLMAYDFGTRVLSSTSAGRKRAVRSRQTLRHQRTSPHHSNQLMGYTDGKESYPIDVWLRMLEEVATKFKIERTLNAALEFAQKHTKK